ncbi:MAG: MMPL family transporter [Pseudomonadota bacterium]
MIAARRRGTQAVMSSARPEAPPQDPDGPGAGTLDRMVARLVLAACRRHRIVLGFFVLAVALAVWAATGLRVDTDSRRMIDMTLPFQLREAALDDAFPLLDDTIAVVVRADSPDAADATLDALGERLRDDPTVADVFAPATDPFFRAHGLMYLPPDDLRARIATLERTGPLLATLVDDPSLATLFTALDTVEAQGGGAALEPLYRDLAGTLTDALAGRPAALAWSEIGTDGTDAHVQRILQVRPVPDYSDLQPVQGTMDAIATAIATLPPGLAGLVEIGVTGDPALRHEELDSVSRGIGLSLGASFVVVAILLVVAYGSAARAGATLLALVVSLVLATGFAALAFDALNLVSVAFVVLLVGLGLDFTIHAFLHVDVRGPPADRAAQVARMGREIGGALVLGAATTACAFLAFVPTDFDGMAQLGILGAAGVSIALLVSLTFVPALVMAWPSLAVGRPPRVRAPAAGVRRRAYLLLGLLVLLVPLALFVGREVRFDADPNVLRALGSPSMQALAWLHEDPETQPYRLSVLVGSSEAASSVADALVARPEVASARMLADFLPARQDETLPLLEDARSTLSDIAAGRGLPLPRRDASDAAAALNARLADADRPAAQALRQALAAWQTADDGARARAEDAVFLLLPRMAETAGLQATADRAAIADLPAPVAQRFRNDGTWRVEVVPAIDPRDQADLATFVAAVEAKVAAFDDATLAGPPAHILRAGRTVAGAIAQAVAVAGLATLVLCFAVLRDWRLVLAIAIPLAAAAAFTAAASVSLGIAFNYANVIVLPLIIGLGVDSGIHLALRHRALRATGTLFATNTPRAVVFSGLTTVAAFGSLALSDHRGTASMGLMLAVAVTLTLAATLIWTPALCDLLDRRERPPPA